jgi:Ca-activated chloride channel family protein
MWIEFAAPRFLLLLLLVPLWWWVASPGRGSGVLFARGEGVRRLAGWRGRAHVLEALPRLLRSLALAALILAIAGPQAVSTIEETERRAIGMALAVDVSSSMLAEDMEEAKDRLEIARSAAVRFARGRSSDQVGLVAFSGEAITRVPLTYDPQVVVAGVESLEVELVPDGTDIAAAILTSTRRLRDSPLEPRVLVLLTDGAHNGRGVAPLVAARVAAALGIRIHAISISGRADTDSLDAEARALVLANQERMEREMQTVLSQVARIGGGRYFHATSAAALDSIYLQIDRAEPPVLETREREVRTPLRVWLLLAALGLLVTEPLLHGSRWGVIP